MIQFTQEQLESMSNLELNVIAANYFYDCNDVTVELLADSSDDCIEVMCDGVVADYSYNPCQSWGDCGDLIDGCEIDLQYDQVGNGVHFAIDRDGNITSKNVNIKRAVTIVYILIKLSQK